MEQVIFRGWVKSSNKMVDFLKLTPFAIDHKLLETIDGLFIPFSEDNILMQYIGLKDMDGNKIFVGDILEEQNDFRPIKRKYKVFNVQGGFAINTHQDDFYRKVDCILFYESTAHMQTASFIHSNCKVIGNIYEHLELLVK